MEKDRFLFGHQEMEAVTLTIATAMDTQAPFTLYQAGFSINRI